MPAPTALASYPGVWWKFNAAVSEAADATTATGLTGSKIARGDTINAYVAVQGASPPVPYKDAFVFSAGQFGVITGDGELRGISIKSYQSDAVNYPDIGGAGGDVTEDYTTLAHYGGEVGSVSLDPQDTGIILAFIGGQVRNLNNQDPYLFNLNGKFVVKVDHDTGTVSVSDSGAERTTTIYIHAGLNIISVFPHASGASTGWRVRSLDQQTVQAIGATTDTGATVSFQLGQSNGGTNKCRSLFCRLYVYGAGAKSETNADILSAMQTIGTEMGWQAKTAFIGFNGDSNLNGVFDLPGMTTPTRVALDHMDWLVMSRAFEAANFDNSGTNDILNNQIPVIDAAATAFAIDGPSIWFMGGATNENIGGLLTGAQAWANAKSCLAAMAAATNAPDARVVITPRICAPIHANNTTVALKETFNRAYVAAAIADEGVEFEELINHNAQWDTLTGSAADVRSAVTTDVRKWSNLPADPSGTFGGSYVVNFVADSATHASTGSCDGLHGNGLEAISLAATCKATAEALIAAGGSRTANSLSIGMGLGL